MDPVVIATGNPHKVEELRAIFGAERIEVESLRNLPGWERLIEPDESGATFEENATIKAISYARQTGRLCLADDSGLEIDALGGRPGVISSHYCTDGRDVGMSREERDRLNNQRVLRELEGVSEARRTARFVCVMVVAGTRLLRPREVMTTREDSPIVLATFRGIFPGRIGMPGDVPRGVNGFGYDPIFLVAPEYRLTSAELLPAEKNRLSHRARAARHMAATLRGMFEQG